MTNEYEEGGDVAMPAGTEDALPIQEESREVKKKKAAKSAVETAKEPTISDIPGVGAATAEKLAEANYSTMLSLAVATPGELVEAAGITESAARKMIQFARQAMELGFQSGVDILAKRERVMKFSTGAKSFNELMGGGFETASLVECFGPYGSGKTQVAHQLCVNVQKQFAGSNIVYIDTEGTFRPERIIQFAKGTGMDPAEILKNIKVAKAYNSDHQILLAEQVEDLITKQKLNIRLLIVDSLTAHFRAEFIGRGTLAERQQKLNKHMRTLGKLADMYNLCVYVTNQVMAKPDQFFGDPTEAIGGHIVGHNSTFRIYLRKGKKGSRVAKLIDAPNLGDGEAAFMIHEEGIRDL